MLNPNLRFLSIWIETVVALLASLILFGCETPQNDATPLMFGANPQHTCVYEASGVKTFGGILWCLKMKAPIAIQLSALLVYKNNVVFVCRSKDRITQNWVMSVSGEDGKENWRFKSKKDIEPSIAIKGDTVIIGSDGVYAIDFSSGRQLWKFKTLGEVNCAPTIVEDTIYAISEGRNKVDTMTGEFVKASSILYALDFKSGTELWNYPMPKESRKVFLPPAFVGNTVYILSTDGLLSLNLSSKKVLWHYKDLSAPFVSAPSVKDSLIYFGTIRDTSLYAFSLNGKLKWQFKTSGYITSTPAIGDSALYFGSFDGYCYALSLLDGKELWKIKTKGKVKTSPTLANNILYFNSSDGALYAVDAATGKELWNFQMDYYPIASPGVGNGVVFCASADSTLIAITKNQGKAKFKKQNMMDVLPKSSKTYSKRGVAYYGSGEYQLCIQECNKAIKVDSTNKEASHHKGAAYFALDSLQEAITCYSKAIELDTSDASEYLQRAMVYFKKKEYASAIQDCDKALELDPKLDQATQYKHLANKALRKIQ